MCFVPCGGNCLDEYWDESDSSPPRWYLSHIFSKIDVILLIQVSVTQGLPWLLMTDSSATASAKSGEIWRHFYFQNSTIYKFSTLNVLCLSN